MARQDDATGWVCVSATYRLGRAGRFPNALIDAKLTPNEPAFQAAFEHADTSVTAAVCLYGFYGDRDGAGPLPSSAEAYVSSSAPPFLIAHGESDPLILVGHARHFAQRLLVDQDQAPRTAR
jgi:acetyl esterase/lipase